MDVRKLIAVGGLVSAALAGCEGPAPGSRPPAGLAPGHPDAVVDPQARSPSFAGQNRPGVENGVAEPSDPRPLPSLEEERRAQQARQSRAGEIHRLPSLEDERRAQQARARANGVAPVSAGPGHTASGTGDRPPVTSSAAQAAPQAAPPVRPPAVPADGSAAPGTAAPSGPGVSPSPAPTPEPAPAPAAVSADAFVPPWWSEKSTEEGGVVSVYGRGEGTTLLEARRAAIEQARTRLREAIGQDITLPEAPTNSTAVRLSTGPYRAFVMMQARKP